MKKLLCSMLLVSSSAFGVVDYTLVGMWTNTYTHWSHKRIESIEGTFKEGLVKTPMSGVTKIQELEFVKCVSKVVAVKMDKFHCADLLGPALESARACNKKHQGKLWLEVAKAVEPCIEIVHPS